MFINRHLIWNSTSGNKKNTIETLKFIKVLSCGGWKLEDLGMSQDWKFCESTERRLVGDEPLLA